MSFIKKMFGGLSRKVQNNKFVTEPKQANIVAPPELPIGGKRKRRSKEEIQAARQKALTQLIAASRARAVQDKKRMLDLGISKYEWLSAQDERTCKACASNNGRIFSWSAPPATGHPGEGKCCPNGHCRCTALAEIKL